MFSLNAEIALAGKRAHRAWLWRYPSGQYALFCMCEDSEWMYGDNLWGLLL